MYHKRRSAVAKFVESPLGTIFAIPFLATVAFLVAITFVINIAKQLPKGAKSE